MTTPSQQRSWWSPRRRDCLALLAATSALLWGYVSKEFDSDADRLLLIGRFDESAIAGLLALITIAASTGWVVARCWVRGVPGTVLGVLISTALTIAACVLAALPALFAGLTMLFSLDNKYIQISASDDATLVLQVFNGWDEDETTRVFRGGTFAFTAASGYGYTDCLNLVDTSTVKFATDTRGGTVSADLGIGCRFTDLLVTEDFSGSQPR